MICPEKKDMLRYNGVMRTLPGISNVLLPVGTGTEVSRFEPATR